MVCATLFNCLSLCFYVALCQLLYFWLGIPGRPVGYSSHPSDQSSSRDQHPMDRPHLDFIDPYTSPRAPITIDYTEQSRPLEADRWVRLPCFTRFGSMRVLIRDDERRYVMGKSVFTRLRILKPTMKALYWSWLGIHGLYNHSNTR